jgi:hypothetical protein
MRTSESSDEPTVPISWLLRSNSTMRARRPITSILPIGDGCPCFFPEEAVLPLYRAFGTADYWYSYRRSLRRSASNQSKICSRRKSSFSRSPRMRLKILLSCQASLSTTRFLPSGRLASLSRLIVAEVPKSNGSVQLSGFKPFLAGHPSKYVDY